MRRIELILHDRNRGRRVIRSQGLGLRLRPIKSGVVQLGGLEPPTSCSTDRRSNQLSYNCILGAGPKKGVPNGAETRCNAPLWQGREQATSASSQSRRRLRGGRQECCSST